MRSIKRKSGIQKGKRSILDRYDDKVIWLSRKKDVEKIIKAV